MPKAPPISTDRVRLHRARAGCRVEVEVPTPADAQAVRAFAAARRKTAPAAHLAPVFRPSQSLETSVTQLGAAEHSVLSLFAAALAGCTAPALRDRAARMAMTLADAVKRHTAKSDELQDSAREP